MNIKVEPFKNNIGASISYDLKLTEPKIIDQIKETLNNYGFVCFRDQNLEPGEYLKFAEQLGKIKEYPMLKDLENYKGITVVERNEDDKGKSYGEGWHTDSSYLEKTHGISFTNFVAIFSDSNNSKQKIIAYYRDIYFSSY